MTHGLTYTVEYRVWRSMKERCNNPKNKFYEDYGGRGIRVCKRWEHSFTNFLEDMGKRPSDKHSLDRHPDNNGNYSVDNCRWATDNEQRRNKRTNKWYEADGKRMIMADWAVYLNINKKRFWFMVNKYSFEYAYKFYAMKHKWNKLGGVCTQCGLVRIRRTRKTLMAIVGSKDYYKYDSIFEYHPPLGDVTYKRPDCKLK